MSYVPSCTTLSIRILGKKRARVFFFCFCFVESVFRLYTTPALFLSLNYWGCPSMRKPPPPGGMPCALGYYLAVGVTNPKSFFTYAKYLIWL